MTETSKQYDQQCSAQTAERQAAVALDFTSLPEWALLVGDTIATTPEAAQAAADIEAEAKRTQCSLLCLNYLYEGGDSNYTDLTAAQNEAVKLTRPEFEELHEWFQTVLPDEDTFRIMQYIMVIHDIGKNSRIFEEMSLDQHAVDHDEVLSLLLNNDEYADQRQELLPTLETLDPQAREIINQVFEVSLNFGQFLQGEAPAAVLSGLSDEVTEPVRSLYVMHAILDIAGVTGHINPTSSLVLNSPTYKGMNAAAAAITNPGFITNTERYEGYLAYRAEQFGINSENLQSDAQLKAKVRLACMLRYSTPEEYSALETSFEGLPESVRAILGAELTRDGETERATLPYYGPALLKTLSEQTSIDKSFSFFAHVLQEAHIADKEARAAGETGVITAELGDLTRNIAQGGIDLDHAMVRFENKGSMLVPVVQAETALNTDGMEYFSPGEELRDKKVLFVGMGGGSDGIQAAMVSKLFQEKYGSYTAAVVSVRADEKPLANEGRQIGEKTVEITDETSAVGGWRFLENIPSEGGVIEAPLFMLNSVDPELLKSDLQALIRETGAEVIVGVDTGGDSLYRRMKSSLGQEVATPDQDHVVLKAIGELQQVSDIVNAYSIVVAPGVDSPDYSNEVFSTAQAKRVELADDDKRLIQDIYAKWSMDGSASESGRYGKTPFAWLAALSGVEGRTALNLPRANVTSNTNPWRAFTSVAPSMQEIIVLDAIAHGRAVDIL